MIKHLENEGKISEKEYKLIYSRVSRPGTCYGSLKVYTPVINNGPKFCPVLSAIGTPTKKVAKFLVPILSHILVNGFLEHDSFSLAEKVFSFCPDCSSLFTNIPLIEIIDICTNDLFYDTNTS